MRLILQASDADDSVLPDQWILYQASGIFTIADYVTQGYTFIDAYRVGAGGGGGAGGRGVYDSANRAKDHGGGGGGGGGGGALRVSLAQVLLDLAGSNAVTVGAGGAGATTPVGIGAKGGATQFLGLTAHGGGGGGGGGSATTTAFGRGGGGASGGTYLIQGNSGTSGSASYAGLYGTGEEGGGAGGNGGGTNFNVNDIGHPGLPGSSYVNTSDFGGGGGAGGGKGTGLSTKAASKAASLAGKGGAGKLSVGGVTSGDKASGVINKTQYFYGGDGGGGGGGVNLQALLGRAGLLGSGSGAQYVAGAKPGGGGAGGSGGTVTDNFRPGSNGGVGCVLIRVYI